MAQRKKTVAQDNTSERLPVSIKHDASSDDVLLKNNTKRRKKRRSSLIDKFTGADEKQAPEIPVEVPKPKILDTKDVFGEDVEDESEKNILDNLFKKSFERYAKNQEANRGVDAIGDVVGHIQSGASMKDLEERLTPLLSEQSSKTTILQAVMFNHMMELVALHWDMRWHLMRDLWQDLKSQKLSAMEKLALLKLADKCADKAASYINNQSNQFSPMTEVDGTMERASKNVIDSAKKIRAKEMEGTTPQGREIIRRLTFKAKQAADTLVEKALKPDTAKAPENSSTAKK